MRSLYLAATLAVLAGLPHGARAATPVTEDNFLVRSTADLVALCGSDKADPLYTPAQNFCQGFAVGTYNAFVAVENASRTKRKWFCTPDPMPTRNEAIAKFVSWAATRPDVMGMDATDGVLAYLQDAQRCAAPAKKGAAK